MKDLRVEELLARLYAWGEARDDVRGIIVFGSQAREARPADRWSDVDLLVFCKDTGTLLGNEGWLERLGEVRVSFLEQNPVDGEQERRALFASGLDVDISFVPARQLRLLPLALGRLRRLVPRSHRRTAAAGARALATILRPGYRILLDKDRTLERTARLVLGQPLAPAPERPLSEITSDFWYHAVWTAKKLRRGELWMAKGCCDTYLKDRFVELYSLGRERQQGLTPARFLDEALDFETAQLLRASFAAYDREGVTKALKATMDLFARTAAETAERLGLTLNRREEEFARAEVARVLAGTDSS